MKRDIDFLKHNLIAHRGYWDINTNIPENSLLAFQKAIDNNCIIELDVHVLKDNKVIVFHDDNLKRMTNIDKNLKDLYYKDIQELKLNNTNEKIPLLEEVLELVKGKVPIIIELKYDVKCGVLETEVIKILKKYNGKYAIKSFNPFSINYFRKNFPDAIRGQLSSDFKYKKMNIIKRLFLSKMLYNIISKPDFISYDIRALPNKKVTKMKNNKLILGWTIKNKDDLKKAKLYCHNYICENISSLKLDNL